MARTKGYSWKRNIAKAVTYKLLTLAAAFMVMTLLLHIETSHAAGVAFIDSCIRFALYVAHERIWG